MAKEEVEDMDINIMDHKNLDTNQNIHALGLQYICNFLDRVGFTIHDVNKDPNHHFQLFAQIYDRTMLIAVRTACHPDVGSIDMATQRELLKESKQLNAVPHFAGLSLTETKVTKTQVDDITKGSKYNVIFNGMTVVRQQEIELCSQLLKNADNTSDIDSKIQ